MTLFKKLTKEEKEERRLKSIKIPLDNLYLIRVGNSYSNGYSDNFMENSYTFARFIEKSRSSECYYEDIFNNSKYYLFGNYRISNGQQCCNSPIPFISIFVECEQKYEILKKNYINMNDAYIYLEAFNNKHNKQNNQKLTNIPKQDNNSKKETDIELTEGKILNDKTYKHEPAIGRDKELKSVITTLASINKSPIIVGESGTGKTTIVDELVYKIQKNEVPLFLKGKQVIELDTSSMIAGTKYVGTLEEKFKNIITYASSNDALLFIDEIHTIYGAGATSKDDNDIAEMLKKAIDRENIRVIGTTTNEEYEKYFTRDALKRRFEPTIIKEPNNETLAVIAKKTFYDYSEDTEININVIEDKLDKIIETLIKITESSKRNHFDKVCNPDLIISIIDKSFANAKINDQNSLTINDIIYGIENCNRIYESAREKAISCLKELTSKVKKLEYSTPRIITFRNNNQK